MHLTEQAALKAFILFDKVYPGKIGFMNFKMEAIDKIITRARLTRRVTCSRTLRLEDTS